MNIKCPYQKTVLVTGASSGIGKETADLFAMNGFIVYAASRHPKSTSNPNIIPLEMDVTDQASVQAAAAKVKELGIIIHCAGFGISGSAEMTPLERAKAQMETNYFGVLNVDNVFLPLLRKNPRSLVLITSSVAGLVSIPYQSHYSSSKYALEAYAQALRMEADSSASDALSLSPATPGPASPRPARAMNRKALRTPSSAAVPSSTWPVTSRRENPPTRWQRCS